VKTSQICRPPHQLRSGRHRESARRRATSEGSLYSPAGRTRIAKELGDASPVRYSAAHSKAPHLQAASHLKWGLDACVPEGRSDVEMGLECGQRFRPMLFRGERGRPTCAFPPALPRP